MKTRPPESSVSESKPWHHSLKNQLTVIFIGLVFLSILTITFINSVFLERYYISRKTDILVETMELLSAMNLKKMVETVKEEGIGVEDFYWYDSEDEDDYDSFAEDENDAVLDSYTSPIRRGSSRQNLSWVIMEPESGVTFCYPVDDVILKSKVFGYAYNVDSDRHNSKIIRKDSSYIVQMVRDSYARMDYLECWGRFDNGCFFLIRTPMESIKDSVSISNTFYLFVGVVIIILSGIVIWIVTKRITKPIIELTDQSKKMSELDFEARYTSQANNEIDELGANFNAMSAQLERTISELKSANLKLTRDIEDKVKIDEMRKEFLDNVSHELKTPIAIVQGYAEGLRDEISEDPETMKMYCDVIIDESRKMNRLVQSLLHLNQLESGNEVPDMTRFNIIPLIRGVIASMEVLFSQSEVQIDFDDSRNIYVWADEFNTERVVTNYLSNACHHVDGEKRIKVQLEQLEDLGKVRISVFNTGQPIPEESLQHLWEKFYKVDKARTREYGGSGIGLSIVKAILDGMQQQYGVINHEDGVEFWFTLDMK
ncbi:MAG: HAMP domain-containing protein [Blautia sp.]|nr:HAMP domain-containing protein [Blautia sp.]